MILKHLVSAWYIANAITHVSVQLNKHLLGIYSPITSYTYLFKNFTRNTVVNKIDKIPVFTDLVFWMKKANNKQVNKLILKIFLIIRSGIKESKGNLVDIFRQGFHRRSETSMIGSQVKEHILSKVYSGQGHGMRNKVLFSRKIKKPVCPEFHE